MTLNCTRFASFNPLLLMNWLGAGSIAVVWVIGLIDIKPAKANPPEQQATPFEQGAPTQLTDFEKSGNQENKALAQQVAAGLSPQQQEPQPVFVPPKSTPVVKAHSVNPTSPLLPVTPNTNSGVTSKAKGLTALPVLATTKGTFTLDSGRLILASQSGCTTGTTCTASVPSVTSVVLPNISNKTLAQLPSFPQPLPVPATPIPVGSNSSNKTFGQLPSFPQPLSPVPTNGTGFPVSQNSYNPMVGQYPYSQQPVFLVPMMASPSPGGVNGYNPMAGQSPYSQQPVFLVPMMASPSSGGVNGYNPMAGQSPYSQQPVFLVPMMASPSSGGVNGYNPMAGQSPYSQQPGFLVPMMASPSAVGSNGYNPMAGQSPYFPQVVPGTAPTSVGGVNGYNPMVGQSPYYSQPVPALPAPQTPSAVGSNGYNPMAGQSPYYSQPVPALPAPLTPNSVGFNGYNPMAGQSPYYPQPLPINPYGSPGGVNGYNPIAGQSPYYPQPVPALPAPQTQNSVGFNGYNPMAGQSPYYPQTLPINPSGSPGGMNGYNPMAGQSPYYLQPVPALPAPLTPSPVGSDSYNPAVGQAPYSPQSTPPLPYAPNPNITPPVPTPTTLPASTQQSSSLRSTALTAPYLRFQGAYVNQGNDTAARARLTGLYPLSPRVQFGGTLDLISGDNIFSDSRGQGLNINELYISAAPIADLPNLRLVVGQLDLTSYFDRNSFAKDSITHFFNPVFQTNPALSATGIASHPSVLVNWTVTDNIEAKAAVFSSSRSIGDFSLDGFAGEVGFRYGNAIVRGTYATDRDAGNKDAFQELFQVNRGGGRTGPLRSDREEAYGVNGEYFFPQLNMGLFARYGRYENQALNLGGNTYSFGISFLDVITKDDRLGLAYGRGLSNEQLRRDFKSDVPDVLELFYDFRFLPNVRLGVTLQQRNDFSETYGGFRVKTEFDITPRGRLAP